jgi:hypothetical protein
MYLIRSRVKPHARARYQQIQNHRASHAYNNGLQPYLSVFEEKASSMLDGRLSSTPLSSRLSTPPPSLNSGSVR